METIKAIFVFGLLLTVIFGIKFYSQKAIAAVGKEKDCANDKCGCGLARLLPEPKLR